MAPVAILKSPVCGVAELSVVMNSVLVSCISTVPELKKNTSLPQDPVPVPVNIIAPALLTVPPPAPEANLFACRLRVLPNKLLNTAPLSNLISLDIVALPLLFRIRLSSGFAAVVVNVIPPLAFNCSVPLVPCNVPPCQSNNPVTVMSPVPVNVPPVIVKFPAIVESPSSVRSPAVILRVSELPCISSCRAACPPTKTTTVIAPGAILTSSVAVGTPDVGAPGGSQFKASSQLEPSPLPTQIKKLLLAVMVKRSMLGAPGIILVL